ncbi:hypothetical protein OZX62_04095 [Bifidobacterium sp. ESL0690]|uniref:hypothetical protein n=1 Tax=Bifidobacterium sp. ESL0690 TaxID=2983214 RepID=UPI0023FA2921|nr:hypothetical protein [Bifidobacterium sp. ESL0690]WEV47456.1 hypothetical protein OZX62_04095 [Bifidobacterium sp. ESL0690]
MGPVADWLAEFVLLGVFFAGFMVLVVFAVFAELTVLAFVESGASAVFELFAVALVASCVADEVDVASFLEASGCVGDDVDIDDAAAAFVSLSLFLADSG